MDRFGLQFGREVASLGLVDVSISPAHELLWRFDLGQSRSDQRPGQFSQDGLPALGPLAGVRLQQQGFVGQLDSAQDCVARVEGPEQHLLSTMGWMAPAPDGAEMSPFKVDERERRHGRDHNSWPETRQIGVSGPCH
jgi:hypothetical protein